MIVYKYSLLLVLISGCVCEEGVCTDESQSCEVTVSEEDVKKNYTKINWTDDYDYAIREELDAADDTIAEDQDKAAEMFVKIIDDHPQSARAKYSLARTFEIQRSKLNDTSARLELCVKIKDLTKEILKLENLKQAMKMGSAQLLLKLSEEHDCHSRPDMIIALTVFKEHEPEGRHSVVLCQELVFEERYEEALEIIEEILEKKPEEFVLNLLKSLSLKMLGRTKEANKFLRGIDLDETLDNLDKKPTEVCYNIFNNKITIF